ncbi:major facilitator superfamily domain-containing protein [Xylogone sp. PMI_703]|nr:major facilitator superfamily domain-containing protein [Xylogone sp. PMI_703]
MGLEFPEPDVEVRAVVDVEKQEVTPAVIGLQEEDKTPPNGGYGWICTLCAFLMNAHTWGINSAWGVFLAYYLSHSTFPGATHLQYSLIGGLSLSQALIMSPVVGMCNRQFGTRPTLLFGSVFVFISLIGASYAKEMWQLFLCQGACFGWGMGFLYITSTAILPQWFTTRRSLAVGISASGAGLGGLAYNLLAGYLIDAVGLRRTYLILASCSIVVNVACSLLMRDWNSTFKIQERTFSYRSCAQIQVVLIIVWGVTTELGYITLLYSLPSYASSIGLTSRQGSIVGALLNLGLGLGRPVVGYFSDKFGRITVAALMTGLCAVLCFAIWIPATTYGCLLAFAILAGCVCGTFWGTVGPVAAEIVGVENIPSMFSLVCFSLILPTTFAEPIAVQIVSSSGYLVSQILVGCFFTLGTISVWLLRTWKIRDNELKLELQDASEASSGATKSRLQRLSHVMKLLFSTQRV